MDKKKGGRERVSCKQLSAAHKTQQGFFGELEEK